MTDRQTWAASMLEPGGAWRVRLEKEAEGLDFHNPEDRACFRGRVRLAMRLLKASGARDLALHLGARDVPQNRREPAIRAVADQWIANAIPDDPDYATSAVRP